MIQKIEAPTFTVQTSEETDEPCTKCGTRLWRYTGESKQQWDLDECKMVNAIKGQLLPCHECHRRESILMDEAAKLKYMVRKSNSIDLEAIPEESRKFVIAKIEEVAAKQRAYFNYACDEWRFPPDMITDRLFQIEERRRKSHV